MSRKARWVIFVTIAILTAFPTLELSRLILRALDGYTVIGMVRMLHVELFFTDLGWLIAMFILWMALNPIKKKGDWKE